METTRLNPALEACVAAVRYDRAIAACAGDPSKMSSFCTARSETLDDLYMDWMLKAKAALLAANVTVE